jgi:tRNA 2-thiouridine synthesizing protein B
MLHIVNQSHTGRDALSSCLRLAGDGHALLLIEDGVLAATAAAAAASGIAAALKRLKVYALQGDVAARGCAARMAEGVTLLDYGGFVDLVVEHPSNQSWL